MRRCDCCDNGLEDDVDCIKEILYCLISFVGSLEHRIECLEGKVEKKPLKTKKSKKEKKNEVPKKNGKKVCCS